MFNFIGVLAVFLRHDKICKVLLLWPKFCKTISGFTECQNWNLRISLETFLLNSGGSQFKSWLTMFIFQAGCHKNILVLYYDKIICSCINNNHVSSVAEAGGSPISPQSSHGPFDQQSLSQAHLMKLFPGSMSSMTPTVSAGGGQSPSPPNIFRAPGVMGQSYAAEFSTYGPMYQNYYKQANNSGSRLSPYHRNSYNHPHSSPASCYQNSFQGAAGVPGGLYPRTNYDYSTNTPR